jgi:hypothetical protein
MLKVDPAVSKSKDQTQSQDGVSSTLDKARAVLTGVVTAIRNTGPQSALIDAIKERAVRSGFDRLSSYIKSLPANDIFKRFHKTEFGPTSELYAKHAKEELEKLGLKDKKDSLV